MINSIAVIGDSTSVGFGTRGRSYPVVLAELLDVTDLEVVAHFGKTTRLALDDDLARVTARQPDLIVLQTGMADSLVHPGQRMQRLIERFAPPAWHGVDGLERRAVFAKGRWKRSQQRATAAGKTALKRSLVSVTGGYTRMQPSEYAECLDPLLLGLQAGGALVVSMGLFTVDQHFFPRQARSSAPFAEVRHAALARHPGVVSVEPDEVLVHWDDFLGDHGHWSAAGHAHVAEHIVRRINEAHPELRAVPAAPGLAQ